MPSFLIKTPFLLDFKELQCGVSEGCLICYNPDLWIGFFLCTQLERAEESNRAT